MSFLFFKVLFIYFQREKKGGKKGGSETSMCVCLLLTPKWGLSPQPRHVP